MTSWHSGAVPNVSIFGDRSANLDYSIPAQGDWGGEGEEHPKSGLLPTHPRLTLSEGREGGGTRIPVNGSGWGTSTAMLVPECSTECG